MITWAVRENIRNPMPDYASSPLETLNHIWDIDPNKDGSQKLLQPDSLRGLQIFSEPVKRLH